MGCTGGTTLVSQGIHDKGRVLGPRCGVCRSPRPSEPVLLSCGSDLVRQLIFSFPAPPGLEPSDRVRETIEMTRKALVLPAMAGVVVTTLVACGAE